MSGRKSLYCPSCRAEYKPGLTDCPDCGVPLVPELPAERSLTPEEEEAASLVEVFSTYNQAEIMLIKALLDAEGIPYHLQGELYSGSGVFITPVVLLVPRGEAGWVREILADNGME